MLKAVGHRLLISPDDAVAKLNENVPQGLKGSGFVIPVSSDEAKREQAGCQQGVVYDVGPTAFRAYDGNDPAWKPWCKVGDRVIFARYSGKTVIEPDTNKQYLVINDDDVQARID